MKSEAGTRKLFKIFWDSISLVEKRKLKFLIVIQVFVNFIDLLGVALLGFVGALTISGIQSRENSPTMLRLLELFMITDRSFQMQVSIIVLVATLLLVSRTLISLYLSKKTFLYFARKSVTYSQAILRDTFGKDIQKSRSTSNQEFIYSTTTGCDILMIGVFAQSTVLISDIALLAFMGLGVAILQPATALVSLLIFGSAGAYMHLVLNKKSKRLGQIGADQAVTNARKVQELLASYREIYASNRSKDFIRQIGNLRDISTRNQAEINYLPVVNKYFLETTLLVGALAVSAIGFVFNDAANAISGLTVFLAAGSRIAPALLRVQQNLLNIRNSLGGARPTISKLVELNCINENGEVIQLNSTETPPDVNFRDVSFRYQNGKDQVLKNLTFSIEAGKTLAISGPSGSGKTTLVDLMLGLIEPEQGEININGFTPRIAIESSFVKASYVPQEVQLFSGTLKDNICLWETSSEINIENLNRAIADSQLTELVNSLNDGVDTEIGEEGTLLSGGQKQRVGIARALYSDARLIVLDEPTSALDGETENFIASAIDSLGESATVVVIAHRLNTLKNVDSLLYLEKGEIVAQGSFEEVRKKVKNFDEIASASGV